MDQSELDFVPSKNSNELTPKQSGAGACGDEPNANCPAMKVCDNCVTPNYGGGSQCCPGRFDDDKGENDSRQQFTTELQPKNNSKLHLDYDGAVECHNNDEIEEKNGDIIARRFYALNASQLERLSLNEFRQWRSTGNIDVRSTKRNLRGTTKLEVSVLVDPLTKMNPEDMKWRKKLLNDKDDMKELLKALFILDITNKFSHPLHGEESDQLQDSSVCESSSVNSCIERRNLTQSQTSLENSRNGGSNHEYSTLSQRTIRKLLEYSIHRGREDECDKNFSDDDDQTADELSCSTGSSFSIPILNFRRNKDSGPSIARQFLDLTDGKDDDERPSNGKRQLLKKMTSWMGIISSDNLFNNDCEFESEDASSAQGESTKSDDKNKDEERMTVEEIDAWDHANAVLIQEVHEISGRLETILNERGLESPYWNAEEVIPLFAGLHSQIKENTDRHRRGIEEPIVDTVDIPTSVSFSLKQNEEIDRSPWAIDDLTGGYDDLGMRRIRRCDRAYLKKFFYEKKVDGTCSLPAVLATGLEKRLPDEVVEAAIDIIDDLTSPIRKRRSLNTLDTINEMP